MCGISGVELLVIIVAAIIILGPDKLPELMRMAGRLARDLRRLRGDLGEVTRELRSQVNVQDLQKELTRELEVDRARERMKEAESEIDAIRSRLNKKVELPPVGEDGKPLRRLSGAPLETPLPASIEGDPAEAATPDLPSVRPAAGTVAQGESLSEGDTPADRASDPTPPPRVRSTAVGAPATPAAPAPLGPPTELEPDPPADEVTSE